MPSVPIMLLIESFAKDSRKVTVSWSDPHPELAGLDLTEIAERWGIPPMDAIDRLRPGGAIYHQMDGDDLDRILSYPPSLVGSDGLPRDRRPHPSSPLRSRAFSWRSRAPRRRASR